MHTARPNVELWISLDRGLGISAQASWQSVSKPFKLVEWILYGGRGNAVSKTPTSSAAEQRPEGESSSTTAAPSSQSKKTNRNGERKLTKAEMAQYRAEGKCFDCGSTEHIRKDCQLHNGLKPPKNHNVSSNAVSFAEIERLRKLKEAQNLGVFSVTLETLEPSVEHKNKVDAMLIDRIPAELQEIVSPFDDYSTPRHDLRLTGNYWTSNSTSRRGIATVQAQLKCTVLQLEETDSAAFRSDHGADTHLMATQDDTQNVEANAELVEPGRELEGVSQELLSWSEVRPDRACDADQ
ncbi:hypothetical protein B0H13DRAFT_1906488 [Mycena leptocephala]|nr:hypothetical protein B0H13DRAFT_1906488 [Mycena leptocephala]